MNPSRRRLLQAAMLSSVGAAMSPLYAAGKFARSRFVAYPFSLGVASGYPTATGVSLWTRLAPIPLLPNGGVGRDEWVHVKWEVAEDVHFKKVAKKGAVRAVGELAHSVHVDVDGLRPGRSYFYRFMVDGAVSPTGRTITAPAAGASMDRLRLALGSCQHFEQGYFESYKHIINDDADVMVFVGDYIYESSWGDDLVRRHQGGETYSLDDYRVRHAQYRMDPDLQAAHGHMPWLLTWDDHEVDNDPAGMQSEHLDPRFALRRSAAYQAYLEHMPLPRRMWLRPDGSMPIHTQVSFGQFANLYMLDDRQYRTPHPCPSPYKKGGSTDVSAEQCADLRNPEQTLLGRSQEQWLSLALAGSNAQWNLIGQQTLMMGFDSKPGEGVTHWTDGWDGYPLARERLLTDLARPGLSNPLVLGGDIHANVVGNLREGDRKDGAVVAAEVCGTSISSQGWPQERYEQYVAENPQFLYGRSDRRGYALIELNKEHADVRLRSMKTVKEQNKGVETLVEFVVKDGKRGIVRA